MLGIINYRVISVLYLFSVLFLQLKSVLSERYHYDSNLNEGKRLQPLIRFRSDTHAILQHPPISAHPQFRSTEEEIRTASMSLPLDQILSLLRKMKSNSIASDTYTVRSIYYGIK